MVARAARARARRRSRRAALEALERSRPARRPIDWPRPMSPRSATRSCESGDSRHAPRASRRSRTSRDGSSSITAAGSIRCSIPIDRPTGCAESSRRFAASAWPPPTRSCSSPSSGRPIRVDRATFRVLVRHGWLDPTAAYDEARDLLVDQRDRVGEMVPDERGREPADRSCSRDGAARPSILPRGRAAVRRCPLEPLLPEGGPREVDG